MIFTIEEIAKRIIPVAKKYHLPAVYLFGSYARGAATEDSDIDLIVDTAGTAIKGLFDLGALYAELETALGKPIDVVTLQSLQQTLQMPSEILFRDHVLREKVDLYEAA